MFQGQQGTQWNYMMAGATISMAPGLLLTILMHRYIFKSIAIGLGSAAAECRNFSNPLRPQRVRHRMRVSARAHLDIDAMTRGPAGSRIALRAVQ